MTCRLRFTKRNTYIRILPLIDPVILDAFDLCLMKSALIQTIDVPYIEPDTAIEFGGPHLTVLEDYLPCYSGPDKSYSTIMTLPKGAFIREQGYQKDNNKWIFIQYHDQYGWIRLVKEDNLTPTAWYEEVAAKPVIYLYPEKETDVHVELELTEAELSSTYEPMKTTLIEWCEYWLSTRANNLKDPTRSSYEYVIQASFQRYET